ncbi:MAG: hypothetical protein HQK97_01255 [Nitrospirae bacterium]|nr:hypothetical protein [Nitrospirota bacterium]
MPSKVTPRIINTLHVHWREGLIILYPEDHHLLDLKVFQAVEILRPEEFLRQFDCI